MSVFQFSFCNSVTLETNLIASDSPTVATKLFHDFSRMLSLIAKTTSPRPMQPAVIGPISKWPSNTQLINANSRVPPENK